MTAAWLERARAIPPPLRIAAAVGALALVVLAAVTLSVSRDRRVALFASPLRPEQLAEVEQRLAAWNVPYAPSGDNVRVDAARRADLLLRLALAGVPHRHLAGSDETLAHLGALTPQSILEAQTRDALAADLALGLRGVDGIADARVVIAPPSAGVYADEPRRDASASVRVTLVPGARLGARVVAGIAAFVAGGVPGLDPARVTVLDDRGLALDTAVDDASDVQTALQSALDAAFGAGATIVRVHREPLGERRDVHDVRRAVLPGAIARSTADERYASKEKTYAKGTATEDRASDTLEEHRVAASDATARLTVAVIVDGARALDLAKIRALAAATVGIRPERGDSVSVEAVPFASPDATRGARPAFAPVLAFAGVAPQALSVLALVLVVAFSARPLAQVVVRAVETAAVRTSLREERRIAPVRVRTLLANEPPHVAAAVVASLPAATATAVLDLYEPTERAAIIARLARAKPMLVPTPEELFP